MSQASSSHEPYHLRVRWGYYLMLVGINGFVLGLCYLLGVSLLMVQGFFLIIYAVAFFLFGMITVKLDDQRLSFRNQLRSQFKLPNGATSVALTDIRLVCIGSIRYIDQGLQVFSHNHPELKPKIMQSAQAIMRTNPLTFAKAIDADTVPERYQNQKIYLWLMVVTSEGELLGTSVELYAPPRLGGLIDRLRSSSLEVRVQDHAVDRKIWTVLP